MPFTPGEVVTVVMVTSCTVVSAVTTGGGGVTTVIKCVDSVEFASTIDPALAPTPEPLLVPPTLRLCPGIGNVAPAAQTSLTRLGSCQCRSSLRFISSRVSTLSVASTHLATHEHTLSACSNAVEVSIRQAITTPASPPPRALVVMSIRGCLVDRPLRAAFLVLLFVQLCAVHAEEPASHDLTPEEFTSIVFSKPTFVKFFAPSAPLPILALHRALCVPPGAEGAICIACAFAGGAGTARRWRLCGKRPLSSSTASIRTSSSWAWTASRTEVL